MDETDIEYLEVALRRHKALVEYDRKLMSECFFKAWKKVFGREFGEGLDKEEKI